MREIFRKVAEIKPIIIPTSAFKTEF